MRLLGQGFRFVVPADRPLGLATSRCPGRSDPGSGLGGRGACVIGETKSDFGTVALTPVSAAVGGVPWIVGHAPGVRVRLGFDQMPRGCHFVSPAIFGHCLKPHHVPFPKPSPFRERLEQSDGARKVIAGNASQTKIFAAVACSLPCACSSGR